MQYKLYRKNAESSESAIERVLKNRGVQNVEKYLNLSDKDICEPELLGKDKLDAAVALLAKAIKNKEYIVIIQDGDVDGLTSSSLLVNYLWQIWPNWVENNLEIWFHEGKQHGLDDEIMDYLLNISCILPSLVILPDAGSFDIEQHRQLKQKGIDIISLDHHDGDIISDSATVINNQLCDYPNKFASGVCITWQFCRYIDKLLGTDFANDHIDLVALGLCGDNMSLLSYETKYLIDKGFLPENIKNPFIYNIWQKNKFKLGEHITNWGAAFYIAPFVNAVCRSGTQEEKELLFNSTLYWKAYEDISSNRRGCKKDEKEMLFEQALRMCTNVKNRQTKAEIQALELLEKKIVENNMLEKHKVLLFTFEPEEIDKNIAGLAANRVMSKYQRPCCILFGKDYNNAPWEDPVSTIYSGSARGCAGMNFKDICFQTEKIEDAKGHKNAFGLFIKKENIEDFLKITDSLLKKVSSKPIYYVDYIFNNKNVNLQVIEDISNMDNLWGADMPESLVAIEKVKITKDNVNVYRKKSNALKITKDNVKESNTLKIIGDNINFIMFKAPEELCNKLESLEKTELYNIIGTCNMNEWNGVKTPQIFIKDMELINNIALYF